MLLVVKGGKGFDAVVSKGLGRKDIENVLSSYYCDRSQCKNLPRYIFCRFDLLNMVTLEVEIEELERIVAPGQLGELPRLATPSSYSYSGNPL